MNTEQARKHVLGFEISRDELAIRIAMPCLGMTPPPGMGATEALEQLAAQNPQMVAGFRRAAEAAALYLRDCINAGKQPS